MNTPGAAHSHQPEPSLPGTHTVESRLLALQTASRRLCQALEDGRLDQIASINSELETCFGHIEQWQGGVAGFTACVKALPEASRQENLDRLVQIRLEHRISGTLIRAAAQRIAALQAFQLAASDLATYAPGLPAVTGSQLSRRA